MHKKIRKTRQDRTITVEAPLAGAQNAAQNVGAPARGAQNPHVHRATARVAPTVGDVVGSFKSLCVKHCLDYIRHNIPGQRLGKFWQRNYYEHIIREHDDLAHIRQYIHTNPARWEEDENYVNK